ncbi:MAG: hypothetical protein WCO44_10325 [Bacteroidota bacterium]
MLRTTGRYFILLMMLASVCQGLMSQQLAAIGSGERVEACIDRNMYVAGENILFSALVFNVKNPSADEISRTLYCELIAPDGKKIASRKYGLLHFSACGAFPVPEEAASGIYYLRFYTRIMRNSTTGNYKYILLKIVNPVKTEVLPGADIDDTINFAGREQVVPATSPALKIVGQRVVSARQEFHLEVQRKADPARPAKLCLSVIPEFTCGKVSLPARKEAGPAKSVLFYPETRGVSISGHLTGRETGQPVARAKVNLSIIGDKDIMVVHTDSTGRFFFALPDHSGNRDIFLCADDMPGIKPEILIDNDFCTRPVSLLSPVFSLSRQELQTAFSLSVNAGITTVFSKDTMAGRMVAEDPGVSFYGEPSEVLVMDKYIELPTLEEYFSELQLMLKVRKIDGRKQFRFYLSQGEMSIYEPLVLVDWVAVNDVDKVLAMSPREIGRIEFVNSVYIKGNVTYGGIVTFVSKKNDFAGINLPSSGTFVNYSFTEPSHPGMPQDPGVPNIPDSRNTVYWNPDLQVNGEGVSDVSFTAPDTPGRYLVLLRNLGPAGEEVLASEFVEVRSR